MDDPSYQKMVRSMILRQNTAAFRRYELKYSSWPFRLFPLVYLESTQEEIDTCIGDIQGENPEDFDVYTEAIVEDFSPDELQSDELKDVLETDFGKRPWCIDVAERLHTENANAITTRAQGQHFTHSSREGFLRQVMVNHVEFGGVHPLRGQNSDLFKINK